MTSAAAPTAIQAVIKHLYKSPSWLGPDERIEFAARISDSADVMVVRATLISPNEWRHLRYAEEEIAGEALVLVSRRHSKSELVHLIDCVLLNLMTKLGAYDECNGLLELANQSSPGSEALEVFVDALLERELIAPLPVNERLEEWARARRVREGLETAALVIARQMLAPYIFSDWSTRRWPLIYQNLARQGYKYSSVSVMGPDGPIRLIADSRVPSSSPGYVMNKADYDAMRAELSVGAVRRDDGGDDDTALWADGDD